MLIEEMQKEDTIVYKAQQEDEGIDLKGFLRKRLGVSSRLLSKLKRDKSIFINNSFAKYHQILMEGDLISLIMQEDANDFQAQDLPFDTVYEDVDIIIVDKEAGMVTHPTRGHPVGTVANAAQHYLMKSGKRCRIRFVNRLDMDTSGLLIIAKNPYAHHSLSMQMQKNKVKKRYLAFVEGIVQQDCGTINAPIYRPTGDSIKRTVNKKGRESLSEFRVLERYGQATLIEVELLTGRTHQIRVHMEHIGHPLIGDPLYGNPSDLLGRQALHANYLSLYQPRYGKALEISIGLPRDLVELAKSLKL